MNISITNLKTVTIFQYASLFNRNKFIEMKKKQFNKNILNKMKIKICVVCNTKKVLIIFTIKVENVNSVIFQEV